MIFKITKNIYNDIREESYKAKNLHNISCPIEDTVFIFNCEDCEYNYIHDLIYYTMRNNYDIITSLEYCSDNKHDLKHYSKYNRL